MKKKKEKKSRKQSADSSQAVKNNVKAEKARQKELSAYAFAEDILPFVNYQKEGNVIVLEDGTYCDFFEIVTKNLASISEDELRMDILSFEKFLKVYVPDIKIMTFSFLTDTYEQQEYFTRKLAQAKNPEFKRGLTEKLNELRNISSWSEYSTKSFILCIYSKKLSEHQNNIIQLFSILGQPGRALVKALSAEKKMAIISKMCNKNLVN